MGSKTNHSQRKLYGGEHVEGQERQWKTCSVCFNLGSESPCMAVIGWASMLDCRPVYNRLDGYRQCVEHHPAS